jgi:hypothetical protein
MEYDLNLKYQMNTHLLFGILITILFSMYGSSSYAVCDCGSTDQSSPCTGQNISVQVGSSRTVAFDWSFNSNGQNAYCGQFANGDYWISPAAGSSSVTITAVNGTGSGPVSLDENPQLESMGLLSQTKTYGNYSAEENIHDNLPITYDYDTSLVSAIQRDESQHGNCGTSAIVGNCADAYHVVTVLTSVPPNAGATILRPSIDEKNKELVSLSSINFTRLPEIDYFSGTSISGLETIRQRWSHSTEVLGVKTFSGDTYSEGGRAFRASLLIDDYGAGVANQWYDDLVMLLSSDHSLTEKTKPLAAMLTYGKDLFFAIYDKSDTDGAFVRTRNWGSGAGQSLGKYPPAVIFASLSLNSMYGDELQKTPDTLLGYDDIRGPHELDQINLDTTRSDAIPVWGDYPDNMTTTDIGAYWGSMLKSQCFDGATGTCNRRIGKKTSRDPYGYIDGPPNLPGTGYMNVSMGPMRALVAIMKLIPEVETVINYQPLMDYVNRVDSEGLITNTDPCAPPDPRENPNTCDAYRLNGCLYYGLNNTGEATWGPDPNNPDQCIRNSAGQRGRFPALHGTGVNAQYTSSQIEANWDRIMSITKSLAAPNPPPVLIVE